MTETRVALDHEEACIKAFVRRHRRPRLLGLLGNSKGQAKLRAGLAHFCGLDARYARWVPRSKQDASSIEAILREAEKRGERYVLERAD